MTTMEPKARSQNLRLGDLPKEPHALRPEIVLQALRVNAGIGLTEHETALRLAQYGPNALAARPPVSALTILTNQVKSPVVLLLAAAAGIAALFGEWTEAIAILLVLAINTLIGFFTELRAVRSMAALRKLGSHASRVRRDSPLKTVPAQN